jgi:hypothetical protein
VLGLAEQPNIPGTVDTHPNWRRRLMEPVDTVLDDGRTRARMAAIDRTRHPKRTYQHGGEPHHSVAQNGSNDEPGSRTDHGQG